MRLREKSWGCIQRKGLVSHLAGWGGADASGALVRWSLSLLLYKGREVGDLMSDAEDCVVEGMVGLEVDDRSSIFPISCALPVSTGSAVETLGKRVRAGDVRERQKELCKLYDGRIRALDWCDWCNLGERRRGDNYDRFALHSGQGSHA